jgi:hypothetical protein
MKYLFLTSAVCVLLLAAGCPKGPAGTADQGQGIRSHSGAQVTPPATGTAEPGTPAGTAAPAAGEPGETESRLELGDMYLGMDYVAVRAKFPTGWQQSPQWAAGAEEQTGIINFTAAAPKPEKGIVTPPEILTYAFLDGKLVAMLRAVPKVVQADVDTYINEMGAKYGSTAAQTPSFAESCDFLMPLRKPAPGDKVAVWFNSANRQLLGVQYSSMIGIATYYLTETDSYTKVVQTMMGTPPPAAPPAAPAAK